MSRARWRVPVGRLAALVSQAAPADLVGREAADRALLEANPVLERIARERPEALGPILDRLRAPVPSSRRGPVATKPSEPPDRAQDGILAENPALADHFRSSPEAALDLLRLIPQSDAPCSNSARRPSPS